MIKFPHLPKADILSFLKSNISLDRNILFKRTIPILSGAIVLLYGISSFIYRTFINKDRIFLSTAKLKQFTQFLEKEGIILDQEGVNTICEYDLKNSFGGATLSSVYSCSAYAKFLIKTSKNHPLKDVPYKDLLTAFNSSHSLDGNLYIMDTVKEIGEKADKSISNAIHKCILDKQRYNNSLSGNPKDDVHEPLKIEKHIYFLDRRSLIKNLEDIMSKKMGEKVEVFEICQLHESYLIGKLKSMDPNINIAYETNICHRNFMVIPSSLANKKEAKEIILHCEEDTKKLHRMFL